MFVAQTRMRLVMIQPKRVSVRLWFGVPAAAGIFVKRLPRKGGTPNTLLSTIPFLNRQVALPGVFAARRIPRRKRFEFGIFGRVPPRLG